MWVTKVLDTAGALSAISKCKSGRFRPSYTRVEQLSKEIVKVKMYWSEETYLGVVFVADDIPIE